MLYGIIGIIIAWFVFGYFAGRMALCDGQDTGTAWIVFALGFMGWVGALIACDKPGSRRKAHFIPTGAFPPFTYIRNKHESLGRFFFAVKER
jgi:hypothetical protein